MIAAGHDVKRGGRRHWCECGRQLRRCPERVAAPLNEQHRSPDRRQMRVTTLRWPAGRMKWIPEQHEPGDRPLWIGSRDLRCDSAAHRLAPDEERSAGTDDSHADRIDDRQITRLE